MARPKGSHNGQYTLLPITCLRCGKVFFMKPSKAPGRLYCSMACRREPRETAVCRRCGKEYIPADGTHGVYCSRACYLNQVEKTCPQCGKVFTVKASHSARRQYCSAKCRQEAGSREVICLHCGKSFTIAASRQGIARYCSRECLHSSQRAALVCLRCGKAFTVKRYRAAEGQRFCSNRCATLDRMEHGWEPTAYTRKRCSGYRTDIEALAEQVLKDLAIPYIFEYKIGRYSVDFALPTLGVALECDGWQHLTAEGRERDQRRNAFLAQEGWCPVHVLDRALRDDARSAIQDALRPILP